jgi:hypothetical protein
MHENETESIFSWPSVLHLPFHLPCLWGGGSGHVSLLGRATNFSIRVYVGRGKRLNLYTRGCWEECICKLGGLIIEQDE